MKEFTLTKDQEIIISYITKREGLRLKYDNLDYYELDKDQEFIRHIEFYGKKINGRYDIQLWKENNGKIEFEIINETSKNNDFLNEIVKIIKGDY